MRVTQVMLGKGFGGAERSFVDISRELAERGEAVQVICQPQFQPRLAGLPEAVRIDTVRCWHPQDLVASWRIRHQLKAFQPDVVHCHLARATHLAGRAARSLTIPVLTKTHNYVKLKYYRHVDRFVPTTQDQRRYLLEQGVAPGSITVIPNFSCLPLRPVHNEIHDPPRLLAYGRMVRKKGFHVLLDALALVDVPIHLTLGGDGPERAALEAQAAQLPADKQVRFAGWLDDVAVALEQADVFVLPSLDEPFGIAVLEAMAAGVPIIATKTKGPVEILDGATALLIQPDDTRALAQAVRESTQVFAAAVGRAGVASSRYAAEYSADVIVSEYRAVFAQVSASS